MNARFIVIEGIDGAGKTSQVSAVATALNAFVAQDGKYFLKEIRETKDAFRRAKLFTWGRSLLSADIRFLLDSTSAGRVVCDRWRHSTWAYQRVAGVTTEELYALEYTAHLAAEPDAVVWLQMPVHKALERVQQRAAATGRTVMPEYETQAFLEQVLGRYEQIFQDDPDVIPINADQPEADVTRDILRALDIRQGSS